MANVDHSPASIDRFVQAYQPDWVSGRDKHSVHVVGPVIRGKPLSPA
jgi:hypothetical protein